MLRFVIECVCVFQNCDERIATFRSSPFSSPALFNDLILSSEWLTLAEKPLHDNLAGISQDE